MPSEAVADARRAVRRSTRCLLPSCHVPPKRSETSESTGEHRPRRRVHGLQLPLHPQQVAGWVILLGLSTSTFVVLTPLLGPRVRPLLSSLIAAILLVHVLSHLTVLLLDPADPELRIRPTNRVLPEFDRSKHLHVIENGRCHLCNITTSGTKTKHCSICNKCVARFDHHCKWLNNCIGGRNYLPFLACLLSAIVAALFVTGVSVAELFLLSSASFHADARRKRNGTWMEESASNASTVPVLPSTVLPLGTGSLVLISAIGILSAIAAVLLIHLCFFHGYIACLGLTTYEYVRKKRERESRRAAATRNVLLLTGSGSVRGPENETAVDRTVNTVNTNPNLSDRTCGGATGPPSSSSSTTVAASTSCWTERSVFADRRCSSSSSSSSSSTSTSSSCSSTSSSSSFSSFSSFSFTTAALPHRYRGNIDESGNIYVRSGHPIKRTKGTEGETEGSEGSEEKIERLPTVCKDKEERDRERRNFRLCFSYEARSNEASIEVSSQTILATCEYPGSNDVQAARDMIDPKSLTPSPVSCCFSIIGQGRTTERSLTMHSKESIEGGKDGSSRSCGTIRRIRTFLRARLRKNASRRRSLGRVTIGEIGPTRKNRVTPTSSLSRSLTPEDLARVVNAVSEAATSVAIQEENRNDFERISSNDNGETMSVSRFRPPAKLPPLYLPQGQPSKQLTVPIISEDLGYSFTSTTVALPAKRSQHLRSRRSSFRKRPRFKMSHPRVTQSAQLSPIPESEYSKPGSPRSPPRTSQFAFPPMHE